MHAHLHCAADGAGLAGGARLALLPVVDRVHLDAAAERAHRADLDAGATLDAGRVHQRLAERGVDHGLDAALDEGQRHRADLLVAGAHAAPAEYAAVTVKVNSRRQSLGGAHDLGTAQLLADHAVLVAVVLQAAIAVSLADRAIERVIDVEQLHDHMALFP